MAEVLGRDKSASHHNDSNAGRGRQVRHVLSPSPARERNDQFGPLTLEHLPVAARPGTAAVSLPIRRVSHDGNAARCGPFAREAVSPWCIAVDESRDRCHGMDVVEDGEEPRAIGVVATAADDDCGHLPAPVLANWVCCRCGAQRWMVVPLVHSQRHWVQR